jgi:hypothetical protein
MDLESGEKRGLADAPKAPDRCAAEPGPLMCFGDSFGLLKGTK